MRESEHPLNPRVDQAESGLAIKPASPACWFDGLISDPSVGSTSTSPERRGWIVSSIDQLKRGIEFRRDRKAGAPEAGESPMHALGVYTQYGKAATCSPRIPCPLRHSGFPRKPLAHGTTRNRRDARCPL